MGFFNKNRGKAKPKGGKHHGSKPYKKSGYGGDRGGRGGYNSGGPSKQVFDVVCAECGCDTTVPFKPTGSKPVLCRDCFRGADDDGAKRRKRDRGSRGSFERDNRAPKRDHAVERKLEELDEKLDILMEDVAAIGLLLSEMEIVADGKDGEDEVDDIDDIDDDDEDENENSEDDDQFELN